MAATAASRVRAPSGLAARFARVLPAGALYRGLARVWQLAPIEVGYRFAEAAGGFVYDNAWSRRREIVRGNMRHVLDTASLSTLDAAGRESLRNYLKYLVEFARFPTMTIAQIVDRVVFDDWEFFGTPAEWTTGWVLVSMHMGNWDVAGACASWRGIPFTVVVDTFSPPSLDDAVQGTRRKLGMTPLPVEHAARGALRALRERQMVGMLIDKPVPSGGVEVQFFGAPAMLPAGAATLALRTGARTLPGALIRTPDNRLQVRLDRNFHLFDGPRESAAELTQRMVRSLEGWIREHPEQWYMFRPMWNSA